MLEILTRKTKESASEYVRRVLEYNIIHFRLIPGEQIQEKELAEALHVSRTPVREAILELKRRNVINIYPQHGTYVSYLDHKSSEEIRYLRYVFEATLIERASAVRNIDVINQMYENTQLQKLYIKRDKDRFLLLDDEYHRLIYEMCGCGSLYDIIKENSLSFDRMRFLSYDLKAAHSLIDEHIEMIRAIERGDGKYARQVCERHLTRAIDDHQQIKADYPQYFKPAKD